MQDWQICTLPLQHFMRVCIFSSYNNDRCYRGLGTPTRYLLDALTCKTLFCCKLMAWHIIYYKWSPWPAEIMHYQSDHRKRLGEAVL